jgi:gliding motility-associated-like protein
MVAKKLLIILLWATPLLRALESRGQSCTTLGQTPATAFPVCGTSVFKQDSVPQCDNGDIPTPCPVGIAAYQDLNPYWYKFTCFVSGTLALTIAPNNQGDDYDWQLFDITGHSPGDVYTDLSLVIGCNWSGVTGTTGTSSSASSLTECASTTLPATGPPIFSKLPQLIKGHNYLLLISHFSGDKQSGYALSFVGGTASITDTTMPALTSATPVCDGSTIRVGLNKSVTCASLSADGSDFTINGSSVVAAFANSCSIGFDLDSLTLSLAGKLVPGNTYTLTMRNGGDQNTLLDNCDNSIPVGASLSFTQPFPKPTALDSIVPPGCAPSILKLVFKKQIQCSSIAANGSDFTVTGPYPVTVTGASALCGANDASNIIFLQLSAPMATAGSFQIHLAAGSDGNTIIDECGLVTPPSTLPFAILGDTVSADFTERILYGCKNDTIDFSFTDNHGVNSWKWAVGDRDTIRVENPPGQIFAIRDSAIVEQVKLIVSNGVCSDTAAAVIPLDNWMKPQFEAPDIMCPTDYAQFLNNSTGQIVSWDWQFGDATSSPLQVPPNHLYPQTGIETKYNVLLIVTNSIGCSDTAAQQVDVLRSCYIAVPSAFTPNGDGLNDYLYPLNAFKADNLVFRVYNRYGQMVYESRDWTQKWDGRVNGRPEPSGTYVWMLQYTDRDSGKKFFTKGTSILIR